LNRKLIFYIILIVVLFFTIACSEANDIKNKRVNELVDKISQMEYVGDVKAHNRAYSMYINIIFENGFTENDSLKILDLAKNYIDSDTVDALRTEFGQEEPPDTNIFFRDSEGTIIYAFRGSFYESTDKTVPPAYTEYRWVAT